MTINPAQLTKLASERFFAVNRGPADETLHPIVAANETTFLIYQHHYRNDGVDVIGIPRAGLEEFIARLREAGNDKEAMESEEFLMMLDDAGDE
jgi:hypothetical protein